MSVAASAAAEAGVGDEGERPTLSPDPKAARQAMEDAEFARDRLKTLLSRLETRCNETAKAEALATWEGEAEEMEARRIAKMTEFADFYPAMRSGSLTICTACVLWTARSTTSTAAAPIGAWPGLPTTRQLSRWI
jgi:hypothetical protein